jgi:hypothetical protein
MLLVGARKGARIYQLNRLEIRVRRKLTLKWILRFCGHAVSH